MPEIIAIPLVIALMVSLVCCCLFLIQVVGALFSEKNRKELRNKPFAYFLMFWAMPISFGLILLLNPTPLKLHKERKIAFERIQAAGGWDAITRDCLALESQHTNDQEYLWWYGYKTNSEALPPAIAALKPYRVTYYPYDNVPIIRIHVLGQHSTDGAWPEYWLWFVCREMPQDYVPKLNYPSEWFPLNIRKMTNSIFEVTF